MSAEDVWRIAARARRATGIELGEDKRQMIYSRLSRRLRFLQISTFTDYLDLLDTTAGESERENFANTLTTNLTAFFRETHHFTHFERELLALRPETTNKRLRVWSAGCSTGEEAYSIAMVVQAQAAALSGYDSRILATDIDTEVLANAGTGVYAAERLRGLPARFRTPEFLATDDHGVGMAEAVRDLLIFRSLNLIGAWPFQHRFDVIFCRNVLIYFSAETKAKVIAHMTEVLRPGGLLYLGHSESILGTHPKLVSEGHTIYRRVNE